MLPGLGDDVSEATVTRWFNRVGDRVEAGEPLVTVAVGKADIEIPAGSSGDFSEISIPAGMTASAGSIWATIEPFNSKRGEQPA